MESMSTTMFACVVMMVSFMILFDENDVLILIDCNNGDIRITGGPADSEGTVEICRSSLWGLVTMGDQTGQFTIVI